MKRNVMPLRTVFSLEAEAGYLDRRAHLMEKNCFTCLAEPTCQRHASQYPKNSFQL